MPTRKRVKSCVDEEDASKAFGEPLSKRSKQSVETVDKDEFSSPPFTLPPGIPDLQPPPTLLRVALPPVSKCSHTTSTASTTPKSPIAVLRLGTSLPNSTFIGSKPKPTPATSVRMDAATTLRSVPQFLRSLWEMVVDPSIDDVIGWHPTHACTFVIRDVATFESTQLSKHFKHKNLASFVRQLNMYQFRKVRNSESRSKKWSSAQSQTQKQRPLMWTHAGFVKGRVDLLPVIHRRDAAARHKMLSALHTASASLPSIGGAVLGAAIGSGTQLSPASGGAPVGVRLDVGGVNQFGVASHSLRQSVDSAKAKADVNAMDISSVKTQIISMHQSFSSSIVRLETKFATELKRLSDSMQTHANDRHRAMQCQLDSFMEKQRLAFGLLRKELKTEIKLELAATKQSASQMPSLTLRRSPNESTKEVEAVTTSKCELKVSSSLEQSERDAVKLLVSLSDKRGKQKRRFETDKGKGAKVSLSSSLPQLSYTGDEDRDSVVAEDERGAAFEPLSKSKRKLLFSPPIDSGEEEVVGAKDRKDASASVRVPETGAEAANIVAMLTEVATGMSPTSSTLPIPIPIIPASMPMAATSSLPAALPVSSGTGYYPSIQVIAAPTTAAMTAPMTTASGNGVYFNQPSYVFPHATGGGFAMDQVLTSQQLNGNGCVYVASPMFLKPESAKASGYITRKA